MNTVLVLGNGFDLEMGLETSYQAFFNSEFCPKNYPAPIISYLNKKWTGNLSKVKWYDLENELLNYYMCVQNRSIPRDIINEKELRYLKIISPYQISFGVFQDEYEEQIKSLTQKGIITRLPTGYDIPYQQDLFLSPAERDRKALDLIKHSLCDYLKSLESGPEPDRYCVAFQVFRSLVDNCSETDTLNIYTFNYTRIPWGFDSEYKNIIHHVHGSCDDRIIIIGTRDEDMAKEYVFLQKAFDRHFAPPPIVEDLAQADEVIVFGHSLGINDRQYFKPLFASLSGYGASKPKTLIIITKDASSVVETKRSLQQLTDNQLSVLMSRNHVVFVTTDLLKDNDNSLYKFLLSHGNDKRASNEIVSKIIERQKNA
jgi:hypothetical protein